MRRFLMLPALALALFVSGCAGTKVGDFVSAVTTTITNPVSATNIYQVKNAYAAALQLAASWREYCYSKPYAVLMADAVGKTLCQNRRAIVRNIQSAQPKAAGAIRSAENFVRDNPTLNASTAIQAAWSAVTAFRNAVPAKN